MNKVEALLAQMLGSEPAADLRSNVASFWRKGFKSTGRYSPIPAEELQIERQKTLFFKGDPPVQIADRVNEQSRMAFRIPRPVFENANDLVVTPSGGAWRAGQFEERYSAGQPGLRRLLEDHRPVETVGEAIVIQSAHCDTYGDWVSEYLVPILRAAPFSAPLLLPKKMASKPFAARDLAELGVVWREVERPTRIVKAHVLRQQKFFVHFNTEEVQLLRGFFGEPPQAARKGSVIYLSRFGEVSDVADRNYPHRIVEEIVRARGGRVIMTAKASRKDYEAAALDAETVIFDHGSAFYNAIGWPVRRAIEIVADSWWNNAFLMLTEASGMHDYTIIRGDLSEEHVRRVLTQTLDAPLDDGSSS